MPNTRKEAGYYSYVEEWKTSWKSDMDALGGYNGQSCDPTKVDPKVIQWAKENCAHMPHFVKVINPRAALGRSRRKDLQCAMGVPIPFVQQHFRELDRVVTLENNEGRTWRVSFGAPRKQPTWCQGWDRVVRDNGIKRGDVVVFVLVRKSCFRFTVFDADGNIGKKSTTVSVNADSASICKEEVPGWSADQDQPLVSNPETGQNAKTRKRLCTVSTDHGNANEDSGYEERDETMIFQRRSNAPDNSLGHDAEPTQLPDPATEPVPPTEQVTEPPCKERKLLETEEKFEAEPETLTLLPVKEENPSNTIKDSTNCEADPYNPLQSSSVPALPRDISPRFESFNPLAFTFKSKRRTIAALERQRAHDLAMAHVKVLTEHHFVCVMLETHVYRDFHLVIPDHFAVAASLPASPASRLVFLDCAGYSWDVYSRKNARNQFALHRKYWALFALHHLLEEGDVCVFALIGNESPRTVLVRIFRVVPVSSSDRTSVHSHYETHEIVNGTQTCKPNN